MKKIVRDFTVVSNKGSGSDSFILKLHLDGQLPEITPGQFVEVRVDNSPNTFLRRPISIFDVDTSHSTIDLLIQVVGHGTAQLAECKAGDKVNLILPLGNSFSLPGRDEPGKVILIGGGVGIAPLLLLGKLLRSNGIEPDYILGFRSKERIIAYDRFTALGNVHITTEDGSAGEKGYVTDHSLLKSSTISKLYCCGPEPMMKAVASFAVNRQITCEVSLENLMACGIGACLCCIVDTNDGRVCACTEGPVFNINNLKWQTSQ